ncbi:MAG: rhodanese-like domain-containing protein [Bacteroidota bacterium]|nr:rhodanese-like domain-containing protein [Bacteroidota bacterium]
MKKIALLLLIFFLKNSDAQTVSTGEAIVNNVNAQDFKKHIDEKKSILIDLRTPDEISKKGKIKGAIEIDYFAKNAEEQIDKLDKKKTYLIYCAGGGRSEECAELMQKKGFSKVINLEKGFDDWKKKGFEVETK